MKLLWLAVPMSLAGALAYVLTPLARRLAIRVGAVDRPGVRKVHAADTPRLGGLAVLVSVGLVLSAAALRIGPLAPWAPVRVMLGIGIGLLPVLVVSVWDDVRPLRAVPKFLAQGLGAGLAVSFGITLMPKVHVFGAEVSLGPLSVVVSIVWIVGVTNAFNIVDGLDGLAGGLALISAASLAAVFFVSGNVPMGGAALVVAGGILGFLPYNVYPAKVFLGDTGSASIGFILACLALKGGSTLSAGLATLVPVFIMGLPVAETFVSMARRTVKRMENRASTGVFEADRGHFHHRLLDLGLDHRRAVLLLWAVGLVLGLLGLLSVLFTARQAGLLLVAIVAAAFVGLARLGYEEFAVIRKGVVLRLYDAPVLKKALFVVFVDLALVAVAVWVAIGLKWDDWGLHVHRASAVEMAAVLAPATVGGLWVMGLYRRAWRLAGMDDFVRLGVAVGVSTFTGLALDWIVVGGEVPVSVFLVFALAKSALSAGARSSFRILSLSKNKADATGPPVAIFGAGKAGVAALKEIWENEHLDMNPVAFLDDDPERVGLYVSGLRVAGSLEAVEELARRHPRLTLLVSSTKVDAERLRDAARLCRINGVRLMRMELEFRELIPMRESQGKAVLAAPSEASGPESVAEENPAACRVTQPA